MTDSVAPTQSPMLRRLHGGARPWMPVADDAIRAAGLVVMVPIALAALFPLLRQPALQHSWPAVGLTLLLLVHATCTIAIAARLHSRRLLAVLCAVVGLQRESMVKLAHKSFIWGVYVAPEARGQGVGTQIISQALSYAAAVLGTRQVNLGVNTKNLAGVALYKKLGFVEYGLERGYLLVGGVLHDEYQMVRHVASAA